MGQSELTVVATVNGLWIASILKAKLEAAGIPVALRYESLGPVLGITIDGLGAVHLCVRSEDAPIARQLLNESPSPEEDLAP